MSAGEVSLRPMRWWDIPAVHALEVRLFPVDPWTVTQFWGELARVPESRFYLVAEDGAEVVGYAGLFVVSDTADVQTIAVAPEQQGRGAGGALLSALIEHCRQTGVSRLQLEVRGGNQAALRLYARAGFTIDGERRDYYGPGQPGILMSRPVARPAAEVR